MLGTTVKQKILLIFFGIIFAFILIEGGLRIGGSIFSFLQEKRNKATFTQDEIRILCLGESTTALGSENSYPSQLEEILNSRKPQKNFKVINKGLVSKTTDDILSHLEEYLKQYQPHIVVGMMGINDHTDVLGSDTWPVKWRLFLQKFRIYQFFTLLSMHMKYKTDALDDDATFQEDEELTYMESSLEDIDDATELEKLQRMLLKGRILYQNLQEFTQKDLPSEQKVEIRRKLSRLRMRQSWILVRIGRNHRLRKNFEKAQEYLEAAVIEDPTNSGAYIALGRCFQDQKEYDKAIYIFKKAGEIAPNSVLARIELLKTYGFVGRNEEAFEIAKWIIQKKPKNIWHYVQVGDWFIEQGYYKEAKDVFEHAVKGNPTDYFLYEQLAKVYEAQGEEQKAKDFYQKAKKMELRAVRYWPMTVRNYNKIADILFFKGIPLICMQYPRRSIEPLREVFWSDYSVLFVENRDNFKEAIKDSDYSIYFSDNFAGNFGHCTRQGNRLIAENLANTILSEIPFD